MYHCLERWGKTLDFLFPIAHHRHWADQQRGQRPRLLASSGALVEQECDELDCLSQTHIVREAGAKPELFEESKPGKALDLVGAQFAIEGSGRFDFRYLGTVGGFLQEVFYPSLRLHACHGQTDFSGFLPQPDSKCLRQAHLAIAVLLLEESNSRFDFPGFEFHPLTPYPDQRRLQLSQLLEFLQRNGLVAQGNLPIIVHNAIHPEEP